MNSVHASTTHRRLFCVSPRLFPCLCPCLCPRPCPRLCPCLCPSLSVSPPVSLPVSLAVVCERNFYICSSGGSPDFPKPVVIRHGGSPSANISQCLTSLDLGTNQASPNRAFPSKPYQGKTTPLKVDRVHRSRRGTQSSYLIILSLQMYFNNSRQT